MLLDRKVLYDRLCLELSLTFLTEVYPGFLYQDTLDLFLWTSLAFSLSAGLSFVDHSLAFSFSGEGIRFNQFNLDTNAQILVDLSFHF